MSIESPGELAQTPTATVSRELATFGPVELEIIDKDRTIAFWRDVIGMQLRHDGEHIELGTAEKTLIVLHPVASAPVGRGHSGLYHVAIHPPTEPDFARHLLRLTQHEWPVSPTDHIISKALYLHDPNGIMVEITLETPERIREMRIDESLPDPSQAIQAIGVDGVVYDPAGPLDVPGVLATLNGDHNTAVPIPAATKVGHVHLHVGNLHAAHDFYTQLGFLPNVYSGRFRMADMSAGGAFTHRIALNTWQGDNAPQAPAGTARMRRFTIQYDTHERLAATIAAVADATPTENGAVVHDPSGTQILLTATGDERN